jgi:hypothetical protein
LELIRKSVAERGYPPTVREIGEDMHISSTNGVVDHLRALQRKGFISREDGLSRGIQLQGSVRSYDVVDHTEHWRSIVTAPRDGTWVLLWSTDRQWVIGCWDDTDECWLVDTSNSDVGEITHYRTLPNGPRKITDH